VPDDPDLWLLIILGFIHDIAIAVYLGGAVAMEFVLGPAQGSIPPAQAQVMGQKTSDRFLWLVWGSLAAIIVTGVLRLERMGMVDWTWPFFNAPLRFSESYGRTLFAMLVLWCVLVINGALVTFIFRPRLAGKLSSRTSAAQVTASQGSKLEAAIWIQRLTRADLAVALVVAFMGASLKWGGLI
jgi:uncharacterized membrane protein